ncbi:MAG TPA: serine/threonine-protein kinase, partial [Gemmataceae bacterium]|nr:serine/threonine-protein kinase [Gemmataceae bacterium]
MTTTALCPHCHEPLLADAPYGLCPVCLLRDVLPDNAEPDRARAEALLARRLPQYQLVGLAGRGGMGEVWTIEHLALGRKAALKLLAPAVAAAPGFAERFLREAKAMANLNHPHIVALYDFGECDGEYFLVMEYAKSNLRRILGNWPAISWYGKNRLWTFGVGDILELFVPLCDAVQRVHESGMVHRDLKPENLLWVDNNFKLADFGLVHAPPSSSLAVAGGPASAGITAPGQVMGTPDYMAPEQWKDPQRVDRRADLYALGLILYEMLTGQPPRSNYPPPSTRARSRDRRLDDVIAKALASEPDARYQSAEQLRADLEAIRARPVHVAFWSDIDALLLAGILLVLGCVAVVGWGKSVACHALLGGVMWLLGRPWYFPWGPRVALRVGCVGCLFLDLVGPLLGLPPLVEPFPAWHPAGWVFALAEVFSILAQSGMLVLAAVALHARLYPKDWVYWGVVGSPGTIQPGLPFRATRLLAALLPFALGVLAIVGYWNEGLWPLWRWL